MKYTTMSLIFWSGPTFAVLTMSSILRIMVSLGVAHELFYALSIESGPLKHPKPHQNTPNHPYNDGWGGGEGGQGGGGGG